MSSHSIFDILPQDEKPIVYPPNKIIKFFEKLNWIYPSALFFITLFLFMNISKPSNAEYSQAEYSLLLSFMGMLLFIPFFIGVKLGSRLYKPQESYLTPKQLKAINKDLKSGKRIEISLNDEMPTVKHKNGNGNK